MFSAIELGLLSATLACGALLALKPLAPVMGLIDSYRRTLELTEIESRLKVLEDEFAST